MIFSTDPSVDDAAIFSRLDFVTEARWRGSWSGVQVTGPIILGTPTGNLEPPTEIVDSALASGLIRRRVSDDRCVRHEGFSGRGVAQVGDTSWWIEGSESHDDRFHDRVSGRVTGYPVERIEPERLRRLAEHALITERVMLALTLTHFAGDSIAKFDQIDAPDALDDLVWKVTIAGWQSLVVDEVTIDADTSLFCEVRATIPLAPETRWEIPAWLFGGTQWVGRIPRAGVRSLEGFSMELPRL